MSTRRSQATSSGVNPTTVNVGRRATKLEAGGSDYEYTTSWGWGRPKTPKMSQEYFAYRNFPWSIVALCDIVISGAITWAIFCCNIYAYITLFPLLLVIFALPSLSMVMIPFSWMKSPGGVGNPEKYFEFVDPAFKAKWYGRKIPIEKLYEAFFAGKLNCKGDLLETLYERESYSRFVIDWGHITFFLTKFIPELLTHSRSQDVEQVREHYDRGDDFYAAFLGPTMIYTSGIFHDPEETLEQAQWNKMELIANKIHLKEGEQHLDLGCGWGTFIAHCAKHYGTNSIGVTLGLNQTQWAARVISDAKITKGSAEALCMDYRDVPVRTNFKKFDKITCLEMSEHVGVKYYSRFCQQIMDMLTDDGIFYLQIAGLRRAWQLEDFNWGLFMGKYIFPGADASCPLGWVMNQLEAAGFEIHTVETIGIHYSATIKRWYDNWLEREAYITEKYGQRWFRLWSWFLAWSVISPEQGSASCYQIVCHKNTRQFNRKQYVGERTRYEV